MKRIIPIFTFAILFSVSCVNMLDREPSDQIASGNMWTTEDLADKGMAGLYKAFYVDKASDLEKPQIGNQERGLNRWGIEALGFPTDYYAGYYAQRLLTESAKKASDKQLALEWRFGYTLVHACNDAIANLGRAGLSSEKYDRYQCEAHFLRAWAYHRLNMLFQGVPIYLEPISNEECTRGRSTPEEVWSVVINDLTYCIDNPNFPDNSLEQKVQFGRPSKGAAYALRGLVYMWLGRNDVTAYAKAAKDFEEVGKCGYGLWDGEYGEFFKPENEKHQEMIFALQFDEEFGYSDNIQSVIGAWDTYTGWGHVKPSADFVDYYQKADGSTFVWNEVAGLEHWEELTVAQREVFFLRDGMDALPVQKSEAITRIGEDIYKKYYRNEGNVERIRKAYENRDPRLKQTVLPPYEPQDCYVPGLPGDVTIKDKEMRHPFIRSDADGGDIRFNDAAIPGLYMYRKYVEFEKGRLLSSGGRRRCFCDWPLIRYTDVLLQWAEALIEQNDFKGAKDLIDQVRTRAHMPGITIGTLNEMREAVRYERRVELCVEGINFFDEVRWGTYKESKFRGNTKYGGQAWWGYNATADTWYYDECMWPWSAPLAEIQRNSNLTRRAGWAY